MFLHVVGRTCSVAEWALQCEDVLQRVDLFSSHAGTTPGYRFRGTVETVSVDWYRRHRWSRPFPMFLLVRSVSARAVKAKEARQAPNKMAPWGSELNQHRGFWLKVWLRKSHMVEYTKKSAAR